MKLISWNVNGIRAAMDKGFRDFIETDQPDVLCLQETKAAPHQVDLSWADRLGYHQVWNCAEKKGYSGTSIWSKVAPKSELLGIGIGEHDNEGRVITATFDDFHLVTVYTPNSQRELTRLDYFWVAQKCWERVAGARIRSEIFGSDHCPVELTIS